MRGAIFQILIASCILITYNSFIFCDPRLVHNERSSDHVLLTASARYDLQLERTLSEVSEEDACEVVKVFSEKKIVEYICSDQGAAKRSSTSLRKMGVEAAILNDRFGEHLRSQMSGSRRVKREVSKFDIGKYNRYDEIMDHLRSIARENSEFVKMEMIGRTREDRDIPLLSIGRNVEDKETRAVWIDAGIHAREWISPASAMVFVNDLVRSFKGEKDKSDDLTRVNWFIAPLLNPDGYEYSHTDDRMWRKNRNWNVSSPDGSRSSCVGVDLNRNWNVVGYGIGASDDPCSNTFKGNERNSEAEVASAVRELLKRKETVRASISLHSYGRSWLTSWGYKSEYPADYDKIERMAKAATSAMKAVAGNVYEFGPAAVKSYPAGGASDDYAKATAKIPYAVTLELPPGHSGEGRQYGFAPPEDYIPGTGREVTAAMREVARIVKDEYLGADRSQQ